MNVLDVVGTVGVSLFVLATLMGFFVRSSRSMTAVGLLTAAAASCAAAVAVLVLSGTSSWVLVDDRSWTFGGARFVLDALGAWFVLVVAVSAVPASIYAVGYCRHAVPGRVVRGIYPIFVLAMILVPAAASVMTFLALWEAMAVTSLALVLTEFRSAEVRSAAQWYAVMTHLGFVALLIGFAWFGSVAPDDSFASLREFASQLSPLSRTAVFLLLFVGFGSKAGLVPLHVWLPRAHPAAPSHVSALMSGAMVKLGAYGLLRVWWDLLDGGSTWWGALVLVVGMLSALFGVLHALVSSDLKRLLAYSTTENMGLIFMGIGAAGLFAATGNEVLAVLAMAAALLHVLNHAAFKSLLFLGAGAVLSVTGLRDLDRLGGLIRKMPVTALMFAVGVMAIAALPPFNGFVSEWMLFQSLVHALPADSQWTMVIVPLAVGVLALTGGLVAATFVKAFGTGFLALPRSEDAERAHEVPGTMQFAQLMLGLGCAGLGVGAGALMPAVDRVLRSMPLVPQGVPLSRGFGSVGVDSLHAVVSPPAIAALVVLTGLVVFVVLWAVGGFRVRRTIENWACGRTIQSPRMEYTATSYAEPLQRIFDDVLAPEHDVVVTHEAESRYFLEAVRYRLALGDRIERTVYFPFVRLIDRLGEAARSLQNGSIHLYLTYGLAAFAVVVVVAR